MILSIFAISGTSSSDCPNLIQNPTFQNGLTSWLVVDQYIMMPYASVEYFDSWNYFSGSCLFITQYENAQPIVPVKQRIVIPCSVASFTFSVTVAGRSQGYYYYNYNYYFYDLQTDFTAQVSFYDSDDQLLETIGSTYTSISTYNELQVYTWQTTRPMFQAMTAEISLSVLDNSMDYSSNHQVVICDVSLGSPGCGCPFPIGMYISDSEILILTFFFFFMAIKIYMMGKFNLTLTISLNVSWRSNFLLGMQTWIIHKHIRSQRQWGYIDLNCCICFSSFCPRFRPAVKCLT